MLVIDGDMVLGTHTIMLALDGRSGRGRPPRKVLLGDGGGVLGTHMPFAMSMA
jgi:hypothetical protein